MTLASITFFGCTVGDAVFIVGFVIVKLDGTAILSSPSDFNHVLKLKVTVFSDDIL